MPIFGHEIWGDYIAFLDSSRFLADVRSATVCRQGAFGKVWRSGKCAQQYRQFSEIPFNLNGISLNCLYETMSPYYH